MEINKARDMPRLKCCDCDPAATADFFVFKYRLLVLECGVSIFLDTGIPLR